MMPDIKEGREVGFVMKQRDEGAFTSILQGGFMVRCKTGLTIEAILREDFGITGEYMEQRLSTVFLDGRCIDDIDSTIVPSGATLALSSAMPGLAGASLRRKGILSSMRSSITHRENTRPTDPAKEGFITLKLFNVLTGELGPAFLERGIHVTAFDLADFLRLRSGSFWSNVREIVLDKKPVNRETLDAALYRGADEIFCLVAVWDITE